MNPKISSASVTIATAASMLALLSYWPDVLRVLDDVFLRAGWFVLHPQTHALLAGILIGGGVAWRVAYDLPAYFSAADTKRRLRGYASGLTFALSWYLSPLEMPWAAVWAAVAALFGQWLLLVVARIVYLVVPHSKPESMK